MKKYKPHFKLIIGIATLILFASVVFFMLRPDNIENKSIKSWGNLSESAREFVARKYVNSDDEVKAMISCLDKHSRTPEFESFKTKDIISICLISTKIKDFM